MRLGAAQSLLEGRLQPYDLEIEEGRIVATVPPAAGDLIAAPGFLDLQVNGFAGVDLLHADLDGYRRAGAALLATGVTGYLPTLITGAHRTTLAALSTLREAEREVIGPRILGAHLEGPFLSPQRAGTHPLTALREPDAEVTRELLDAGPVRLVTLAPELPGALELITLLRERGVLVSLGHSDATREQARAGFDAGATAVTHLFNAMRPLHHREPGIVGAALERDDSYLGLIADGVHLHPAILALVARVAPGRVVAVTDAVAATGMPDGSYSLGEVAVHVRDGVARREDGVLAGSTLTVPEAVRALRRAGLSLEDALATATATPARFLGRADLGVLRVGGSADVALIDPDITVRCTLLGGHLMWEARP